MRIILASASPRRRELLSGVVENFEIITASTDETLPSGIHPREGVGVLAARKGSAVRDKLLEEGRAADELLIISADTLVEADGVALGKPLDEADAKRMLRLLSGRWHNVHTGVAVHYNGKVEIKVASTAVLFRTMSDREIDEYVASGEPMDKAGSYGIQGLGGKFVEKFDGDYDTVVGLSMKTTVEIMENISGESFKIGDSYDKK